MRFFFEFVGRDYWRSSLWSSPFAVLIIADLLFNHKAQVWLAAMAHWIFISVLLGCCLLVFSLRYTSFLTRVSGDNFAERYDRFLEMMKIKL